MTLKERASCINTIELLKRMAYNVHGLMDVVDAENCDKIIKMLNDDNPHWTPCSEKLPLTYEGDIPVVETYIVTVSVDGVLFVDKAYSFGTYIDGFWDTVNDWDEGNDVHVLAWMSLPEAYTGGGDA